MPFIIGIIGIAFWFRVGRILTPALTGSKCLRLITDNSYSIMANQILGFMFVKTVFAILSKSTSLCGNFDMHEYKTNIWYSYLPKGISQWAILYVLSGIIIPIIIQICINKIKMNIIRHRKVPVAERK